MPITQDDLVIKNRFDLQKSVALVDQHLQAITDYLATEPKNSGRIRFPRGFIGTVDSHSKKFAWMNNSTLRRNLAYQLIYYDVLKWVGNRTDLSGLALQMLYKNAIVLVATIAESFLIESSKQAQFKERKFQKVVDRFVEERIFNSSTSDDLEWLWGLRNEIHLHLLKDIEFMKYKGTDIVRANKILTSTLKQIQKHFDELAPPFEVSSSTGIGE